MYNFISFPCICQPKNLRNSYGLYKSPVYKPIFLLFRRKIFSAGLFIPLFFRFFHFADKLAGAHIKRFRNLAYRREIRLLCPALDHRQMRARDARKAA